MMFRVLCRTRMRPQPEYKALMKGEVGSIDHFRIVVAQEMQHWAGVGATVGTNPGYRETGGKYDVFPMLTIGQGSFTTIGFQTDGNGVKFSIII